MKGDKALEIGLIDELVGEAELADRSLEFAKKLALGGQKALSITKHWLNELEDSMVDGPFERAAEISAEVIVGEEAQGRLRRIFKGR